jgi:hypothetical protein
MAAKSKKQKFKLAVLDTETDPFQFGRAPLPFTCGFYDGESYHDTWGDNCIADMMEYLDSLPDNYRIYVHNGGGFDFYFLQDFITNPLFFIKSRVAKCGLLGRHELRDSYKMLPIPLSAYAKEEIDYRLFEYGVRERHKAKIRHYQFLDCKYLFELVSAFINKFGDHLTIGSAAIRQLKRHHPNKHESTFFDALFREYYLGGRTECFEVGELIGDFKIYDVNSMYPYVMAHHEHPYGNQYKLSGYLPDSGFYFAKISGTSRGALPVRSKAGTKQISFPKGYGEFVATSHEIRQAQSLGLLDIHRVIECRTWTATQNFKAYVDECMTGKLDAEARGDKAERTFYKLLANNGYGKFGQDPRKYRDCIIVDSYDEAAAQGYTVSSTFGDRLIAEKPSELKPYSFNNVAIAASITSASRAQLMLGLAKAERAVYCDTDSIICESLDMPLHPTELGAWKTEAQLDRLFIAGKKLYAGFYRDAPAKKASKGVDLDHSTIAEIALGNLTPVVNRDAPLLRFGREPAFISRKIRRTA